MPAPEGFDGQGDEGDVLSSKVVESACHFPLMRCIQGNAAVRGAAVDETLLEGRDDCDVERRVLTLIPGGKEDVSRARL